MRIVDISGPLGADILEVDPRVPLTDDEIARLETALASRLVLRFRGTPLSAPQLAALARQFGKLQPHIAKRYHHPDDANIVLMTNQDASGKFDPVGARRGEGWHSDGTFEQVPPKATVLHSEAIPDRGGNTKFANMQQAFKAMPEVLKKRLSNLDGTFCLGGRNVLNLQLVNEKLPDAVAHPVVRIHPVTGLKSVFVNPTHSLGIVGMNKSDADELLDEIFARCEREEFQWQHEWRVADTVVWDNRGAWHQATLDYPRDQLRKFIRTTVSGTPIMQAAVR